MHVQKGADRRLKMGFGYDQHSFEKSEMVNGILK